MDANVKNEKLKRAYIEWLAHASQKSEKTIDSMIASIYLYDDFTINSSYHTFSKKKAIRFKENLASSRGGKGALSASTIRRHLRNLQVFFHWLYAQPGYKSKMNPTDFVYLSPDNSLSRLHLSSKPRRVPSLEYVKSLINSIDGNDEISMRDRALISFLCLTGIRDDAAASLSLGSVDMNKLRVVQDPNLGVRTKFRKFITSYIFAFDKLLLKVLNDWVTYLNEAKLFSECDPLFPATKIGQCEDGFSFEAKGISRTFWKSSAPISNIFKVRSKAASLEYYVPHSFRHLTIQHCMKFFKTPEELKAISQSLGHEAVMTTLRSYGTLDSSRVEEVIYRIDFDPNVEPGSKDREAFEEAFRKFMRLNKRT